MINQNFLLRFLCILLFQIGIQLSNRAEVLSFDPNIISLNLPCGDDSLQLCTNLEQLSGNWASLDICQSPSGGYLSASNDTCFFYHPNTDFHGNDFVCLIICDDLFQCDTFQFEIEVEDCNQQIPCANINYDLITESVQDCNGLVKICNPFPLGEALLYDYTINGFPYTGNIGICSFDTLFSYSFSSLPGGGMEGPYELESWEINGSNLGGTFDDLFELEELMNMLDPLGSWSLDTNTSNIITFNTSSMYGQMTIVQTASNDISILNKNSTTAPIGSSIQLPPGLFEVALQHQQYSYCVDTFTVAIHCSKEKFDFDTIQINEIGVACIDTFNLPGKTEFIDAECINCDNIEILDIGDCTNYRAMAVGTDTLLLQVCDEFGFCDTMRQSVTVIEDSNLPIARIDVDTTDENTPIKIDVLANDFLNGGLQSIFIVIYPQHGNVIIGTDFLITYIPEEGFCGIDDFAYEICNENGCDTTITSILVRCKSPLVYNGFSPNEDGINDTFKIFNLESYPSNHLKIFNRWGNLVFDKSNYKNDWKGESFSGSILPDGTYYYYLEIEGLNTIHGFVQINR